MIRYLVAYVNTPKIAKNKPVKQAPKKELKTFDVANEREVTAFVISSLTSETRELISVSLHDFTTHQTIPLEPVLEGGKIQLVRVDRFDENPLE